MSEGSRKVVLAALAGNVAIALCKFGAAYMSRSTATLAEAVHSLADTGNQALLLVGMQLAAAPRQRRASPSAARASSTSGRSSWRCCSSAWAGPSPCSTGWTSCFTRRSSRSSPGWSYAVLGVSLLMEGASFRVAMTEFRKLSRRPLAAPDTARGARSRPSRWCWPRTATAIAGLLVALSRWA